MHDLEHVRRTARSYAAFQGLRLAPWGGAILTDRLLSATWPAYLTWQPLPTLVLLVFAAVLSGFVGRAYEGRFGAVRPIVRPVEMVSIGVFLSGLLVAGLADARGLLPLSLFGVWLGLGFLVAGLRLSRVHYTVAAAPFLLLALTPTIGLLDHSGAYLASGWVAGIALLAVGVVDHLWLTRALGRRPTVADA